MREHLRVRVGVRVGVRVRVRGIVRVRVRVRVRVTSLSVCPLKPISLSIQYWYLLSFSDSTR